jgi:hypothetical protein
MARMQCVSRSRPSGLLGPPSSYAPESAGSRQPQLKIVRGNIP